MKTLFLTEYGGYLGTEKFDFVIKKGEEKLTAKPFHLVNEISLSSGNSVSIQYVCQFSFLFHCVFVCDKRKTHNLSKP